MVAVPVAVGEALGVEEADGDSEGVAVLVSRRQQNNEMKKIKTTTQ